MEHLIAANYQTYFINQKDELDTSGIYKCEGLFADFLRKFKPGYGQMKSVCDKNGCRSFSSSH
jgi:hypothetical protein